MMNALNSSASYFAAWAYIFANPCKAHSAHTSKGKRIVMQPVIYEHGALCIAMAFAIYIHALVLDVVRCNLSPKVPAPINCQGPSCDVAHVLLLMYEGTIYVRGTNCLLRARTCHISSSDQGCWGLPRQDGQLDGTPPATWIFYPCTVLFIRTAQECLVVQVWIACYCVRNHLPNKHLVKFCGP